VREVPGWSPTWAWCGRTCTQRPRVAAYDKAMAGLAARNSDDHEAQIFHALATLAVAYNSPPDKTYARQKRLALVLPLR